LVILFDITNMNQKLSVLEKNTTEPNFWDNMERANKILQELKSLKSKIENYSKIETELNNLIELSNLILEDYDDTFAKDLYRDTKKIEHEINRLEIQTLLSGKYDRNNAIITIHPGAGGTESQDWAEMLYRMYTRWCDKKGYTVKELEFLEGDEAGIKSVTFLVVGENAYGYLKSENGVHRLVRISPFDSGGRRHTSFASLEVLPEISEDISLDINLDDLRIDTYRSSGAGRSTH